MRLRARPRTGSASASYQWKDTVGPVETARHQRQLLGLQPVLRPRLLRVLPVRRGHRRDGAARGAGAGHRLRPEQGHRRRGPAAAAHPGHPRPHRVRQRPGDLDLGQAAGRDGPPEAVRPDPPRRSATRRTCRTSSSPGSSSSAPPSRRSTRTSPSISNSGPDDAGATFDRPGQLNRAAGVDMVDEHYYNSPTWFLQNNDRYDAYDRSGPKVFLGEYASQDNKLFNALTEAAYMTGLERNADVVKLASYAPLLANERQRAVAARPDLVQQPRVLGLHQLRGAEAVHEQRRRPGGAERRPPARRHRADADHRRRRPVHLGHRARRTTTSQVTARGRHGAVQRRLLAATPRSGPTLADRGSWSHRRTARTSSPTRPPRTPWSRPATRRGTTTT